jgi:Cohesin domain/PEP-CTERM motif
MKKLLASTGLAVAALFGATAAQSAVVLSFVPSATHIDVGGSVTIDVSISGLAGAGEVVSAYDVNAKYDPAVLAWQSVSAFLLPFGDNDNGFGEPNGDPVVNGNIGLWLNSYSTDDELAALQGDGFKIFSFQLAGIANGQTQFGLGADPDFERLFVGRRAGALDVQIGSLCISVGTGTCVQSVPEPTSYALVGMALGALGLVGRRRNTAVEQTTT